MWKINPQRQPPAAIKQSRSPRWVWKRTIMRDRNYRETLLSYLDVLGFKKLVEKSVCDARLFADILSLLHHLKDQTGQGGRYIHDEGKPLPQSIFRAFNFSDLVVRATYADTNTSYFSLCQWEFLYLCSIQINLV